MRSDAAKLMSPFRLGDLDLRNRVVMAPLTRNRATAGDDAPQALNAVYYRQRASAGLIISEAAQISRQGQGYWRTPGHYTDIQTEGWKLVTRAVHEAGGRIFTQLWHVGRVSHVDLQANGGAPVAPSAIKAKTKTYLDGGFADVSMPRALELHEIPGILEDYARAAANAKAAGFDGIEVHGANGYLVDQFLRDGSNKRTDAYGGSLENRMRFPLEVVDAILKIWPAARVGYRIGPVSPANDIADSNPDATFNTLAAALSTRGLAYLHVIEGQTRGPRDYIPFDYAALRKTFKGAYMGNNGYTREIAIEALEEDRVDLIAFGRPFIANPDLVRRLAEGIPFAELNQETLYGGGETGYADYPVAAA